MFKMSKLLLPHERKLIERCELKNVTHLRSSSIWLEAPPLETKDTKNTKEISLQNNFTNVYRVMGDIELLYLLEHKKLPDTQPYIWKNI